jgi:putative transposase
VSSGRRAQQGDYTVRKSRITESQIVSILKELDAGTPASELGRKHGIHANTIRLWRDRYTGLEASELVRLRQLEDESRRKDRIIAKLTLEVDAMKELVEKNGWGSRSGKSR